MSLDLSFYAATGVGSTLGVVPKKPFDLPLTRAPCRNFYKFGLGLRAGVGIAQGCLTEGLLSFLINLSILWSMSETALLSHVVSPFDFNGRHSTTAVA